VSHLSRPEFIEKNAKRGAQKNGKKKEGLLLAAGEKDEGKRARSLKERHKGGLVRGRNASGGRCAPHVYQRDSKRKNEAADVGRERGKRKEPLRSRGKGIGIEGGRVCGRRKKAGKKKLGLEGRRKVSVERGRGYKSSPGGKRGPSLVYLTMKKGGHENS